MNIFEDSVTYQFITQTTKGSDGDFTDLASLPVNSCTLVGQSNAALTETQVGTARTDGTPVRVAQRVSGDQIVYSPYFVMGDSRIEDFVAVATTQQVTYLGYNAVTEDGELDATAGATYTLGVVLQHTAGVLNTSPMIKTVPYYNVAGTQSELAFGLLTAFDRVMSRENRQSVRCERVNAGTVNAEIAGGTASHVLVTNGSRSVIYTNGSGVPADGGADHAAGTVISLKGVAYIVTANDGNEREFTLDSPYKGVTEEIASGTTPATQAGLIGAPGDWGLRFTGVAIDSSTFNPVTESHRPVVFKLSWDRISEPDTASADPTTITYEVDPVPGIGTFEEVAVREVYTTMNEGNPFISAYPPTNYRKIADSTQTYKTYVINGTDESYTSATTGQRPVSKFNIYVCVATGLTADIAHFDELTA